MRILIIGGTNFMGPAVARELLDGGHTVAVFHRGKTERDVPADVTHIHGDQRDLPNYADEFAQFAPEVVIHMTLATEAQALTFVATFTQAPLAGVTRRAVVISSQDVYHAFGLVNRTESGPPDPIPLTEDAPLREHLYPHAEMEPPPGSEDNDFWRQIKQYDKILVERVVMGAPNLAGTVLRLPAVYGPRDQQHRTRDIVKRVDDGRRAIIIDADVANWRWAQGYVDDMAHAIVLAATDDRAAGHIYNVAEADPLTYEERARALGRAAGWQGEIVIVPHDELPVSLQWDGDATQDVVVDTSRIRRDLGYAEALPREERLARAVAWERANPPAEDAPGGYDYAAEDEVLAGLGR